VDILDNNVGISVRADVLEVTEEAGTASWRSTSEHPARLEARHSEMKKAGSGSIITSLGGAARQPEYAVHHVEAAIVG